MMAQLILIDNNQLKKEVEPMVQVKSKNKAPPRYDEKLKRQIAEAAESGMSLKEILEKFPPRKRCVFRILKRFDVKLQN